MQFQALYKLSPHFFPFLPTKLWITKVRKESNDVYSLHLWLNNCTIIVSYISPPEECVLWRKGWFCLVCYCVLHIYHSDAPWMRKQCLNVCSFHASPSKVTRLTEELCSVYIELEKPTFECLNKWETRYRLFPILYFLVLSWRTGRPRATYDTHSAPIITHAIFTLLAFLMCVI